VVEVDPLSSSGLLISDGPLVAIPHDALWVSGNVSPSRRLSMSEDTPPPHFL